ncbi:MAG: hypothetical protein H8E98_02735 [Bacteroidetes bacterium]|nr:hypothetical protein [Bacteroidota bacterium]
MKVGRSKVKGNTFENKIAKQLGTWMFNNKDILSRSITSGAKKSAYLGDIVPVMQIPWKTWSFNIECKHGYKNNIPNLNNQKIVRDWIDKVIDERGNQSLIIYLIIKFHGYGTLLSTDLPFNNITAPLIINHQKNGNHMPFYFYNFEELLTYNFYELYNNNEKLKTEVFKI